MYEDECNCSCSCCCDCHHEEEPRYPETTSKRVEVNGGYGYQLYRQEDEDAEILPDGHVQWHIKRSDGPWEITTYTRKSKEKVRTESSYGKALDMVKSGEACIVKGTKYRYERTFFASILRKAYNPALTNAVALASIYRRVDSDAPASKGGYVLNVEFDKDKS